MNSRSFWPRVLVLSFLLVAAELEIHTVSAASQAVSSEQGLAPAQKDKNQSAERKDLFEKTSTLSGIPWAYLAAVDQYERTMNIAKKRTIQPTLVSIYFSPSDWTGILNPNQQDTNPKSIAFFRGYGKDGSGDGIVDRNNDLDVLASMAFLMSKGGLREENIQISLWNYYQNSRSVERIKQFATIFASLNTLDLAEHAFPLPIQADYSYRSTWGDSRGWGGHRIHEGTDLFARYGVPVRSTCFGIIEVKGWNPYGGWRIGIRDINNVYHYYAHLSGFQKGIKEGDIVKPGQTIGRVGSSGYGKPGTSGKFPPHLHFGLYRDNGLTEWSFDPYPSLRKWEREDRVKGTSK
ncbi:peptidoglycan DD-metalloendopeptidase family protein [Paenibacillus sp. SYP-B3998]|uniref:Peptidoglycan DD-metalloendopeptidase family protein n=1 Tax=Paenibacillus sp. SYP-B3998 TaxID=2678564 RepID=A0A6G4A429_9BACL|nr:M23 family metallopeptidase [Paenibacillus sp. SYP-B3998]NEW08407.1 peptidoglycan DD-metalloendopeptidase family protein [Paenibacillus sp. SYP-B3998]